MSAMHVKLQPESHRNREVELWNLTFPGLRLAVARILVAFCFVWPFFNYALIDPTSTMEVNFLPIFLAALLLPEVTARETWSILLALPVFYVAFIGAGPTAALRLAIGIIPLHFILNLTHHLRERGDDDILPLGVAYRALQALVGFSMVQVVDLRLLHVIPEWLTAAFMAVLPRYSGRAYDDSGIRGVQGWASEPSGAAMMCIAFSLVAIRQHPDRRWRILALFALFATVNKSVYSLVLLALLSLACIATLQRKRYVFLVSTPIGLASIFLWRQSNRLADLYASISANGISRESNMELIRMAQVFYPIEQFPKIYKPPVLFGTVLTEPTGLLPLIVGYGSIFGVIWLAHLLWVNFPLRHVRMRLFALLSGLVLFLMVPPDLIPTIVAFAVFTIPNRDNDVPRPAVSESSPCL